MADEVHLNGHHRRTLESIFSHPVGHNIEWHSVLSLLGILLIIHADFRSLRLTALVALTLPFALIGGA